MLNREIIIHIILGMGGVQYLLAYAMNGCDDILTYYKIRPVPKIIWGLFIIKTVVVVRIQLNDEKYLRRMII